MFAQVQVLRGIAAAMVVCVHYVASQGAHGGGSEWLHAFGASGVDIFFVISGFIMMIGQSGGARRDSAAQFLVRRLLRIAPLYWVLTIAAFMLSTVVAFAVHARYSPEMFAMSMLFLPHSDSPVLTSSDAYKAYVISMAWTLTYEWYFYLVFALTLALDLNPVSRLKFFAWWFGGAVALGMVFRPSPLILQMLTSPLVFEFLAGCAIAMLYRQGVRLNWIWSCAAVVVGMSLLAGFNPEIPIERTIVWGGAAFCLVAAATLFEGEKRLKPWGLLVEAGDISYALYLSHFFTVALFVRMQARLEFIHDGFGIPAILTFALLSFVVAEACHRLVEQPARFYFSKRFRRAVPT